MSFSLDEQTLVFLEAILLGAAGGLMYDLCRAARRAARTGTLGTALADLVFWLAALGGMFYFAVTDAAAQMRGFVLLGEGLGMALYFLCFTPLLLPALVALMRFGARAAALPPKLGGRLCLFAERRLERISPPVQILKKLKKKLPFLRRLG